MQKSNRSYYLSLTVIHLLLAIGISLGVIMTRGLPVMQGLELGFYDLKLNLRGPQTPNPEIVIVSIDKVSLDELGAYPFRRDEYANVLQGLHKAGARFVAFDFAFASPSPFADADRKLGDALAADRKVLVAAASAQEFLGSGNGYATSYYLPTYKQVWFGSINSLADADNRVRRFKLLDDWVDVPNPMIEAGKYMPHFALQIVRKLDASKGQALMDKYRDQPIGIHYAGPPFSYSYVPFYAVSRLGAGKIDKAAFKQITGQTPAESFQNKIVIVSSQAALLKDSHDTPFLEHSPLQMPGAEILANAVDTLMHDNPYRFFPDWQEQLIIASLALIAALLLTFLSPLWELFSLLLMAGLYTGLNLFLFLQMNLQLALFSPLLAMALVYAVVLIKDRLFYFIEPSQD